MLKPKFSIILCLFNSEKFLYKSVGSVLRQTYQNWELIIVNDGSCDNTEGQLVKMINGDSRVHYYRQENKGIGPSRNFALRKCSGDFLLFLDHDDYFDDNTLEVINNIIADDLDFIIYSYRFVNDEGKTLGNKVMENGLFTIRNADERIQYFRDYFFPRKHGGEVWGRCFKKSFCDKYSIVFSNDTYYSDDYFFCYQASIHANKFIVINNCLINNTQQQGSLSRSGKDNLFVIDTYNLFCNIFRFISNTFYSSDIKSFYLFTFLHHSYISSNNNRLTLFSRTIKTDPIYTKYKTLLKNGTKIINKRDYLFAKAALGNKLLLLLYRHWWR